MNYRKGTYCRIFKTNFNRNREGIKKERKKVSPTTHGRGDRGRDIKSSNSGERRGIKFYYGY
jgi:hypothetical protein